MRRLLLDGVHLIREAHSAGLSFDCVAVSIAALDGDGEAGRVARSLEAARHEVVAVSEPVLRAISPVRTPSGIVAIARRTATGERMLDSSSNAFFLVVSDVQDPGNLGALVRVAEAGAVTQVVVVRRLGSPVWMASLARQHGQRAADSDRHSSATPLTRFPP